MQSIEALGTMLDKKGLSDSLVHNNQIGDSMKLDVTEAFLQ